MSASRKICTLDQLLAWRNHARLAQKTVVHCHGCFDIVHPGHILHLQHARSLGDVLVVTVSGDSHVNKGVDRPLIPDDLRAASLAALECVDAVYVNDDPTAVALLERLQPDIYVKGKEYENNFDPRFAAERNTVEAGGGRVVYSSGDVVFSSSALIDGLSAKEPFHDEKVQRFRNRYDLSAASIGQLMSRFHGRKVVVVGDYILDRYHFCDATGVAGEGPMMALRHMQSRDYDGGAAVIALHLAGLGADVSLVSALADDAASELARMRLVAQGITVSAIRHRRQLVTKSRFLVDQTKLFKVDEGAAQPADSKSQQELGECLMACADGADAVIFADFGYGVISAGLLDQVMKPLRAAVKTITADVSGRQSNLLRFHEVDLLCPTEREARETLHDFSNGLGFVIWNLLEATRARHAMITLGKQGLVTFSRNPQSENGNLGRLISDYLPALASTAIDPMGCGDALLATASLTLAAGGSLQQAAYLGNVAAAIEAQCLGNQPITATQMAHAINTNEMRSARRLAS